MALIGLVRVSTDKQRTQRQHDALDPICLKVFEETVSGKLSTDDRPGLLAALSYIRDGDMLTVQEVDRLGRNLLEGLIVLNDLFQRGIAVKVLEGIAAGEHTERSLVLDLALALAEDRRRDIVRKTRDGLEAARLRGRVGGRRPVVDDDKRAVILARRQRGESIRTIAAGVKVSVGVVHKTLAEARSEAQQEPLPGATVPATASPARYPARPGRLALVIDDLAALHGPATGEVVLPLRLYWSPEGRVFDLGKPHSLRAMYTAVLRESIRAEELATYLDGATLAAVWPELRLPKGVRRGWEERHPVLQARAVAA